MNHAFRLHCNLYPACVFTGILTFYLKYIISNAAVISDEDYDSPKPVNAEGNIYRRNCLGKIVRNLQSG